VVSPVLFYIAQTTRSIFFACRRRAGEHSYQERFYAPLERIA